MRVTDLAATAAILLAMSVGSAMARPAPSPRDFNGLWSNGSLTELERPDDFKALVVSPAEAKAFEATHRGKVSPDKNDTVGGKASEWWELDYGLAQIRGQVRTSWIVAPADGKLPFNAAAQTANKARSARRKVDFSGPEARNESERCLGIGASPPMLNGGINDNVQFVQTADQIALHAEWMHDVRIVPIGRDLKHPPASVRVLGGDSIGHWEGDTLVIETTNFSAYDAWSPTPGAADHMRVVERISRVSPNELLYAFRVTDPAEFTQTWQGELVLHATRGPIYEYACHEGNYALEDMLRGGRAADASAASASAAH